ncbi:MAG: phosphoribosylformylglycinamidine synthase subunit PurS, partial [Planctomycetota bacterium]|nr:phosphoribosylformylglycinamidine synthase subunit PurS [Planctomycetota bacterium]
MKRWQVHVQFADPNWDAQGVAVHRTLHGIGLENVERVAASRIFILEGDLSDDQIRRLSRELLCDPVSERFTVSRTSPCPAPENAASVEVHPRPGVMDPVADSVRLAAGDLGLSVERVRTARRYEILGLSDLGQLERAAARVLANDCIEHAYLCGFGEADSAPLGFAEPRMPDPAIRHVAVRELNDSALETLSRQGHLFLSLEEMRTIQNRYRDLGREPTDLELETFAQTWSEHCVHKTLKSAVLYRGAPMPGAEPDNRAQTATVEIRYKNLLRDTIVKATRTLDRDWCLSVFEDNAGIIEFDEEFGVAFKVETHNHPSAIEPFGGAATGVGGCIRDVMGCGLGARPIANTNVFCLAPPDWPWERLPDGVLHPRAVLEGVVSGVRDYGNRMGIPTVNGALHFDPRYLGNPLVYVGCVGIIPRDRIAKSAAPGDRIVLAGGRTGRDGIHGATFSSAELTDGHADEFAHAVQIGNPITQKKLLDCILQARDHADGCLYSSITDCGAGGLSSAVGEMGAEIGARVDLDGVPLKHAGLRYDEIWISEAQERMVLAVPPERVDTLVALFAAEDVEATVIGEFTDDKKLTVRFQGERVGELDMDFLHKGRPEQTLTAEWHPPKTVAA